MKTISLSQGKFAIVDDADFEELSKYKWHVNDNGYAKRSLRTEGGSRTTISMQRYLLQPPVGMQIDHINGNRADNRRENLRVCTQEQNLFNKKVRKNKRGTTVKGVEFIVQSGRWRAKICFEQKYFHLGCFDTEVIAADAYNKAAKKYFGEFARLNQL